MDRSGAILRRRRYSLIFSWSRSPSSILRRAIPTLFGELTRTHVISLVQRPALVAEPSGAIRRFDEEVRYSSRSGDSFDPTQRNDLEGAERDGLIVELRRRLDAAPLGGSNFLSVLSEMGDPWIVGKARQRFVEFVEHQTVVVGRPQAEVKRYGWKFLIYANRELPEREDWSHIEEAFAIKDLLISRFIVELLSVWVFQDDYGKKVQLILDIVTYSDNASARSKTLDFLRNLGAPLPRVFLLKDWSPEVMAEVRAFLMENPFHIAENHPAIAG